jgi:prophage regulatory protein
LSVKRTPLFREKPKSLGATPVTAIGDDDTFEKPRVFQSPRLLRVSAVLAMTGLARSTMYARVRAGMFPKPVSLGPRAVAWVADEIEAWVLARIRERDDGEAIQHRQPH